MDMIRNINWRNVAGYALHDLAVGIIAIIIWTLAN